MSKLREQTQAQTKQIIGQIVGDDELVREGVEQQRQAEPEHEQKHEHEQKQEGGPSERSRTRD